MKNFLLAPILALCAFHVSASQNVTADIAVIGAGGAGLTAAVQAANLGATVIVLEKAPVVGGNTLRAEGGLNAADTPLQTASGIEDSAELSYYDTMKSGHWINDPDLVKTLADNASESLEWLLTLGADLREIGMLAGVSKPRTHRPQGGKPVGPEIVKTLFNAAKERNVDIRTNARVTRILTDKGRVTGVIVKGKKGIYTVNASAVVNAAGGFAANNELVSHYAPQLKGYRSTNTEGTVGDGIKLAQKLDADTVHMERIQTHPTVVIETGTMISEALRGNGAILVNSEGKRFANELDDRDSLSRAILTQPGGYAYLIFDSFLQQSLRVTNGYITEAYCLRGETYADLAREMHVEAMALETALALYRSGMTAGRDQYGRPDMPSKLAEGPFYAVKVTPAVHHTMGGLKIDTKARVLDKSGNAIPGLFAAGEVTGGIHGANRLGGNAQSENITFGRIAGTEAYIYSRQFSDRF